MPVVHRLKATRVSPIYGGSAHFLDQAKRGSNADRLIANPKQLPVENSGFQLQVLGPNPLPASTVLIQERVREVGFQPERIAPVDGVATRRNRNGR